MNTIRTTSVVKDGRITVEVPTRDGTSVDVIVQPAKSTENIDDVLEELRRVRAGSPARISSPEEVKRMIEGDRP